MANTINIRLKIDGVEKSITNIEELEGAILEAKNELKGLSVGTKAFNDLAASIKVAEEELKNFNKDINNLNIQEQVRGFVKLGEGIVGAFTLGLSALQNFGIENKNITEAQLKITQLLTISLGARQVAEGLLNLKIVANTIAQKANNLAIQAGTKATRTFYTLIASNPYGALLAVVGTLATAFLSLGRNTEEAGKKAEETENKYADLEKKLKDVEAATKNLNQQIEDETKLSLPQQIKLRDAIQDRINTLIKFQKQTENSLVVEGEARKSALALNERYQENNAEIDTQRKRLDALNTSIKSIQKTNLDKSIKSQQENFKLLNNELDRLIQQFNDLSNIRGGSALIVEELKKILDARASFAGQVELARPINELFDKTFNINLPTDFFGKLFENYRKQLTEAFETGDVKTLKDAIDNVLLDASSAVGSGKITIEAFNAVRLLTDKGYKPLLDLLNSVKGKELLTQLIPTDKDAKTGIDALNSVLGQYFRVTGIIKKEKDKDTGEIIDVKFDATTAKKSFDDFNVFYKQLVDNIFKDLKESGKFSKELDSEVRKLAEETAQGILKGYEEVVRNEDDIRRNLQSSQKLFKEIGEQRADAVFGFLLQYGDKIKEINTGLSKDRIVELSKFVNDEKRFYEELTKDKETLFVGFNQFLRDLGVDEITITQLTEEQKLQIVKDYLQRQITETQSAEQKKRSEIRRTITDINRAIQDLSQILGNQFNIFAENLNLQQQILERKQKEALAGVVGDTEAANKKRIQIQEDYAKRAKELEKEQRLLQLRSQQAQAVVNTATAITSILATFAANPIAAAILTSITAIQSAAQIGIIEQQINETKKFRRGGFLSGGASHENGGYRLGGNIEAEQGETIINRTSSLFYRNLLSQLNQSNGGRPIVSTPYDDSRLIEALNRVNTDTPIRAYVVERDITRSQEVNKRLSQLSRF
jgi:hypothetical protein